MKSDNDRDIHYAGDFEVIEEMLPGELVYNRYKGIAIVAVTKLLADTIGIGKSYGTLPIINGSLNNGIVVTLFNNRCIENQTQVFHSQFLQFRPEYFICGHSNTANTKFNKMICILENAYAWSGLEAFKNTGSFGIELIDERESKTYGWFGAKITFSSYIENYPYYRRDEEEITITQRLCCTIETEEEHDPLYFVDVRKKVTSLISFAIKGNVNIIEEYLTSNHDFYMIHDEIKEYYKYNFFSLEPELYIDKAQVWDFNFLLTKIDPEKDINDKLDKLTPILNLYSSLFKYPYMPIEMIFLNIIQAVETFHARFFYNNEKKKYLESVYERFEGWISFDKISRLLLSDTQMDENCSYIILVSRINDLFLGQDGNMFFEYWNDESYAQAIADTRHYYTHYGKAKEAKALKGNDLNDAIFVMRTLLEYHICLTLGIDNREKVRGWLASYNSWKQVSSIQAKEISENYDDDNESF